MAETVADLVARWDTMGMRTSRYETFNELHARLDFFRSHFAQYLPALGSDSMDYEGRLEQWLANVTDEDHKRALLELAAEIVFFTREDFLKLYQSAVAGPVTKWVIDELKLDLADPGLSAKIQTEIHDHTWFCSLTDSMPIADFYHANNLTGTPHRPDCKSLARFGDPVEIEKYMTGRTVRGVGKPLKRIVVLEDFVGSGTQMSEFERTALLTPTGPVNQTVFDFLASLPSKPPLLFVPLMICPAGLAVARTIAAKHSHLRVDPLMNLGPGEFINPSARLAKGSWEEKIAAIAYATYPQVVGDDSSHPLPYTPYGFQETGARIVMFSNTPANTLSLIHHKSNTWEPLFRRSARVRG